MPKKVLLWFFSADGELNAEHTNPLSSKIGNETGCFDNMWVTVNRTHFAFKVFELPLHKDGSIGHQHQQVVINNVPFFIGHDEKIPVQLVQFRFIGLVAEQFQSVF
jgi:hypothetical protein